MPNRTLEGRLVHGIEITKNVNAADGKPVFFQMGVHHAREWPSAEMPMEFATDLVKSYGKDARITNLVNRVRTIVVPVINPDGYNLSREAEIDLQPSAAPTPTRPRCRTFCSTRPASTRPTGRWAPTPRSPTRS